MLSEEIADVLPVITLIYKSNFPFSEWKKNMEKIIS